MSDFKKGDRVVITNGDFEGQQATIVDKDLLGDGLTVALVDGGREIKTEEGHVKKGAEGRMDVEDGDRVIVTEGRLKGERGTVLSTNRLGKGIKVRLDDGKEIDTEEGHVAPVRD